MGRLRVAFGLTILCLLALVLTSSSPSAAPITSGAEGGIDLSYSFPLNYPDVIDGSACRILSVPRTSTSVWHDLLCFRRDLGSYDTDGNSIYYYDGDFPQFNMHGEVDYNPVTGLMVIKYEDGEVAVIHFTPKYGGVGA